MDLEVRHLKLVQAVAACGGLTCAGRELHVTQSALSHQLRDVESRLGTAIFLRVGKRMVLTAAGIRLLRSADEVLEALQHTEDAIRRLAGSHRSVLRFTTGGYMSYHWLPAVLREYARACPKVDVHVAASAGNPAGLLLDGQIELAIVGHALADDRLIERPLLADEMVAVVEPGHRLAARRFVEPADLAGERLLLDMPREDSAFFKDLGATTRVPAASVQIVGQTGAMVELVLAGLGIALLMRWAVEPFLRSGALRALSLSRDGDHRQWRAVTLKDLAGVSHIRTFVDIVARLAPSAGRKAMRRSA